MQTHAEEARAVNGLACFVFWGWGGGRRERERRQGMFKGHVERTTGRTTTTMNVFSGTMNPAALRERGCLVGLLEVEELSFRVVAEMGSIHASWKYRWK